MAGEPANSGGANMGREPVEGLPPGVKLGPPPGVSAGAAVGQEPVEGLPPGVKLGPPPGIPAGAGGREQVSGPPPGMKLGRPPGIPAGAAQGGKEEIDELPPGVVLGQAMPPTMKGVSALPYLGRSLGMLRGHLPIVVTAVGLAFIVTLLPFVSSAAFGPLMQMLGVAAAEGSLGRAWMQSGPLVDGGAGIFGVPIAFSGMLALWAGALVLGQILGFIRSWFEAQLEWRLLTEVRQRAHDHLQSLSLDFFTGERSGSLMQRVLMEASSVQRLITQALIPPIVEIVVLVLALIYLLALSWQMTIVALALSPLAVYTLKHLGRKIQETTGRMVMASRHLGGELEETISGIADVQIFNAQQQRSQRFYDASKHAAQNSAWMITWIHLTGNSAQVFIALSTALVLIVGIAWGEALGLTFSSLVVFVQFVPTMFAPAQRIIQAYTDYQSLVPSIVSTYDLLDTKPTVAEQPGAEQLPEVHGNITFENVVFGYPGGQKILDGLSFSIKEGETIALVGAIGSGKSTIFNLLLRFLDPQAGRIILDGRDISKVTLATLREQVSKLSQFPFFMKESIRENVRLGRQGATDAEVEDACKTAHIHEVITDPARISRGYETVVDVQVPSGGQKRLIAMARCLLRKPEVLLLDEPTENLDADQRVRLTRIIREYAKDRTCIVISHDMDFIAAVADRILVLSGGKVTQEGSHAELLERGGLYRQLYEAQNVDPALVRRQTAEAIG
ncbi:MAG: ABC transporter transmembrane domain-containing protein [Chloroflexota bacterium]